MFTNCPKVLLFDFYMVRVPVFPPVFPVKRTVDSPILSVVQVVLQVVHHPEKNLNSFAG